MNQSSMKLRNVLVECIESTFVSNSGKYIDIVEQKLADFTGAKYAISTINGTSALHICLLLAGVKAQTEVLTQSLSFVATSNAIKYCGAEPIFIDVAENTLGMCPNSLASFLKQNAEIRDGNCYNNKTNRKITACLPMHTFGHPCAIDEIQTICLEWKIPLIEDSAESLGSSFKNSHTGNFGILSAISFNGNKIITAGGGGAILTNDKELSDRARHITKTAKTPPMGVYSQ